MKNIASPIDRKILEKELSKVQFIRKTNFGDNDIYIFDQHNAPGLMQEVGRLREIAFRNAGGGTGKDYDIDNYDISETPYKQLIVWDSKVKEILGGYRFICGNKIVKNKNSNIELATTKLFKFSEEYVNDYLPYTIELGRSFVQTHLVNAKATRKSLFALDNLWDGLGSLIVMSPNMKYFMGKVTMYPKYNSYARDLILYFLNKHFIDDKKLLTPINSLTYKTDIEVLANTFPNNSYKENHKILSKKVRDSGEVIPPLINSYMNLSSSMKCFGTSINKNFGNVEETGIMITIKDIYESKKRRHLE